MSGHTPFQHLANKLTDESKTRVTKKKTELTRPTRESVKVRAVLDPAFLDALLDEMDAMAQDNVRLEAENVRMQGLIAQLHAEGVLSEGQAAKATGLDRVALRKLADESFDAMRKTVMDQTSESRAYLARNGG